MHVQTYSSRGNVVLSIRHHFLWFPYLQNVDKYVCLFRVFDWHVISIRQTFIWTLICQFNYNLQQRYTFENFN